MRETTHVISASTLRRWAEGVITAADHCDDELGREIADEIRFYGGANADLMCREAPDA
jgi:hypothetical protein